MKNNLKKLGIILLSSVCLYTGDLQNENEINTIPVSPAEATHKQLMLEIGKRENLIEELIKKRHSFLGNNFIEQAHNYNRLMNICHNTLTYTAYLKIQYQTYTNRIKNRIIHPGIFPCRGPSRAQVSHPLSSHPQEQH